MNVVINEKLACHDEAGLIYACELMRNVNSTKVRADVLYLNRKGYPCRRYRPCCIEYWEFGSYKSFCVYGDGFIAKWAVKVLRSHYCNSGVWVDCGKYDTPRSHVVRYL